MPELKSLKEILTKQDKLGKITENDLKLTIHSISNGGKLFINYIDIKYDDLDDIEIIEEETNITISSGKEIFVEKK